MLGDKNLARSGVSCVLLAYLAGEIWETAVTSNSNQRSTGMSLLQSDEPTSSEILSCCSGLLGWTWEDDKSSGAGVIIWWSVKAKQNKTNTMGEISEGQSILWHTCQS